MKRLFGLITLLVLFLGLPAQSYYSSVDEKKGGAELKTALYNLVKNHTRISYGTDTWKSFAKTDVKAGTTNQVWDMYSNEVRYYGNSGSAVSGMNIEHSFPKSWWGGTKNDAYYDLNHLNPSDQKANSAKSNYPLGEVSDEKFNNGVSKTGSSDGETGGASYVFEPADEYKGDFARTYFYMVTCYQNLSFSNTYMVYENSAYPTLKDWAVKLLLKWHRQDPVSTKEVTRNNAVYGEQNNRNPYIDYPQLAEYVWGDSVNYIFHLSGEMEKGDSTGGGGGGGGDDEPTTIAIAAKAATGTTCYVEGTVVAVNAKSFLLSDETASILVYLNAAPANSVGDVVTVKGAISTYGGLNQFTSTAVITKTDTNETLEQPKPEKMYGTDLDEYLSDIGIRYVTYTGVLHQSGNYYNVTVADAETAIGSITYPTDDLTELLDDTVSVTGYLTGVSGSVYVNTMATEIKLWSGGEPLTPGAGTEENPYTVAEVVELNSTVNTPVWVIGEVGGTYVFGGSLTTEDWSVASNIALISSDATTIIPVQLPTGDVRDALNLVDNPDLYGKTIKVYGTLEYYFSVPGVKGITDYRIVEGTGIEETAVDNLTITGNTITAGNSTSIDIYNMTGQCIAQGIRTTTLQKGIYIVKQGKQRTKVLIGG